MYLVIRSTPLETKRPGAYPGEIPEYHEVHRTGAFLGIAPTEDDAIELAENDYKLVRDELGTVQYHYVAMDANFIPVTSLESLDA